MAIGTGVKIQTTFVEVIWEYMQKPLTYYVLPDPPSPLPGISTE